MTTISDLSIVYAAEVTAPSRDDEAAAGLQEHAPWLLEDELKDTIFSGCFQRKVSNCMSIVQVTAPTSDAEAVAGLLQNVAWLRRTAQNVQDPISYSTANVL